MDRIGDPFCRKCNGTGIYGTNKRNFKCYTCDGTGRIKQAPATIQLDATKLFDAFAAAQANNFPKPTLRMRGLKFKGALGYGNFDRSILVLDAAADFEAALLGRIQSDGRFMPSTKNWDSKWEVDIKECVADPATEAVKYGLGHGVCSVCGRALSNPESIELGIGPICRGKMGWTPKLSNDGAKAVASGVDSSKVDLSVFDAIVKD